MSLVEDSLPAPSPGAFLPRHSARTARRTATFPARSGVLAGPVLRLAAWVRARRDARLERRALMALLAGEDRLLADIGLDRHRVVRMLEPLGR